MDFYKKIIRNKRLRFKIISMFKFVPDEPMLKFQYRMKLGRTLNLDNPKRYTEKLQWYKLHYRDPKMQICADKYSVRAYVEEKGLGHILNDLYATFESPEDICFDNLPDKFILKLSNGSSTNLVCEDKDSMDLETVKKQFKAFFMQSGSSAGREWVYRKEQKPIIVAEKFLEDPNEAHGALRDYKILCFNGKVEYIICVAGRYTKDYCHIVYDADWNKIDVKIGDSSFEGNYEKPETFDEMKKIAETLSADFPAARIDLYSIEGKIYFGEITFFPWSGYQRFYPDSFDYELGEKFVLPEKNN